MDQYTSLPWFELTLAGVILVVLGVPLYLRRIPRNPIYGVRFPSTFASDDVWYPINARGGRDMIVIGLIYLGLLGIGFRWGAAWSPNLRVFIPVGFMGVALIVETIILWRASRNLKRQLSP